MCLLLFSMRSAPTPGPLNLLFPLSRNTSPVYLKVQAQVCVQIHLLQDPWYNKQQRTPCPDPDWPPLCCFILPERLTTDICVGRLAFHLLVSCFPCQNLSSRKPGRHLGCSLMYSQALGRCGAHSSHSTNTADGDQRVPSKECLLQFWENS